MSCEWRAGEATAGQLGWRGMGGGMAAAHVMAQVAAPGFWGVRGSGNSVDDFGQDVGGLEPEPVGRSHDLVSGVGGQSAGDLSEVGVGGRAEQVIARLELAVALR